MKTVTVTGYLNKNKIKKIIITVACCHRTAQLVFVVDQCGAVTSPEVASPEMTSPEVVNRK
jgi:hypothetical protein